ncbi:MAG: hypothetical protein A2V70_15530, partial [Planctomycetes bacterium RBG_13_63_9]
DTPQDQPKWPDARGVLEEVLTGEVLTRVWSAVLCAYDRRRGTNEAGAVARSVMVGHLEARHRVLTLLSRTPAIDAEAAVKLNYLRRRTERWTDLLLGHLAGLHEISEFAIDPARAKDFARGLQHQGSLRGGRHAWAFVLASLRASFQRGLSAVSPNADLNAKIASSVLSCLQPELFDSVGLLHSLWMLRLLDVADDAQGMLQDLLALEQTAAEGDTVSEAARWQKRLRRFGQ